MAFSMMEAMGDYMAEKNKEIVKIHIDKLHNDPNNDFRVIGDEEIAKKNALLMDSIEQFGLLDPIIVRPHETAEGHYTVVSGHRRLFAHEMLAKDGKKEFENVSCIIITPDKTDAQQILLEANLANRDISDYEKMQAVKRMNEIFDRREEAGEKIKGRRRQHIAEALGMSVSAVGRLEKIEKSLSEEYKQELKEGNIGVSVADKLASKPEEEQKAIHATKGAKVKLVDLDDDKPEDKNDPIVLLEKKAKKVGYANLSACERCHLATRCTMCCKACQEHKWTKGKNCNAVQICGNEEENKKEKDEIAAEIERDMADRAKEKQETPPPITQPEEEEDYCTTASDFEKLGYRVAEEALLEAIDKLQKQRNEAIRNIDKNEVKILNMAINHIGLLIVETDELIKKLTEGEEEDD